MSTSDTQPPAESRPRIDMSDRGQKPHPLMSQPSSHVRPVYRVIFRRSHFHLQVANVLYGSRRPLVWQDVASQEETRTQKFPASAVPGIHLPNGANLIERFVVETHYEPIQFDSLVEAREYAVNVLGIRNEATSHDVFGSVDEPETLLQRLLRHFRWKL